MRAAYYESFSGSILVGSVKDPSPSPNGVVIELGASGLCLSDWHGWKGHDPDIVLPHVPGHELAGTIVETGSNVKNFSIGERVTVPFVCGCGNCEPCQNGNHQVCDHQFQPGFTAWGSFAQYVAIDYADENLVRLPQEMSFVDAASLGCRFVTAYRAVMDQAKLRAGQTIAIHGCGGVGLSAIQIAKAIGARVIAVDITDGKCSFAKELGADYSVNAANTNVPEAIREISKGGVQVSVDALGLTETCLNSINSLRKRGKHIQVGLMTGSHSSPKIPMDKVIANELEILGSHGIQAYKYPEIFRLIRDKKIDVSKLITQKISLEKVPTYLPVMHESERPGISVINAFY